MSLGAILAAAAPSIISGAATATAQSLAQGAINARSARRSYKFTKKLYGEQARYNQEAFERENARQDYLLSNMYDINRQALKNAGYSTADPNGTGMQAPSVSNMDVPTASQFDYGIPQFDLTGAMANAAQLRLMDKQAENVEANTKKTEAETYGVEQQNLWIHTLNEADLQKKLAETEKAKEDGKLSAAQAYVAREMLELSRSKNEAEINEINEHIKVLTQQANQIEKEIEVAQENIYVLRSQKKYYDSLDDVNKARSRVDTLEGDALEVRNKLRVNLAKYGIDLDQHDVKTLMYLEAHGFFDKGVEALENANSESGRDQSRWDKGYSPRD